MQKIPERSPDGFNGKQICLRKKVMNFLPWNMQGTRTKLDKVLKETKIFKVLTGTKKKGTEEFKDFVHFYSGVGKDIKAAEGVNILIKKRLSRNIKNWEQITERLIIVEMKVKGHESMLVGVYALSEDEKGEIKDTFYENLIDLLENKEKTFP